METIKRIASKKRTWVILAGIATGVAQIIAGAPAQAVQTIAATLFGSN